MTTQKEPSTAASSRRAFLKRTVTVAYVAPLVVSMPAIASKAGYGSGKTDKGSKYGKQQDKDQQITKYEPENCPDPLAKDGRGQVFTKYTQSPYTPNNSLSQGPDSYQFQTRLKSHFQK